jgi:hypothetical protein
MLGASIGGMVGVPTLLALIAWLGFNTAILVVALIVLTTVWSVSFFILRTKQDNIRRFDDLVEYLENELGWPLDGYGVEDLTYDFEPEELGLKRSEAAKIKSIRQLRPLQDGQPWGIFFIEFDHKRLPIVVLRRILSHLVIKKRASANQAERPAWDAHDLLFISAFGPEEDDKREIGFAHFQQPTDDLPTLRVLGWDGADTSLKLNRIHDTLKRQLHWPEQGEPLTHWRERWAGAFKHKVGHVIRTADALAVAVFVDKPFKVGDRIQLSGIDGTVEEMGLRATRVRSVDGFLITVPNKAVGNNTVINVSARPTIRTVLNYGLTYDTSAARIRQATGLLREIFRGHPKTTEAHVTFNRFDASSLNLEVVLLVGTTEWTEYIAVLEDLNLQVKERFDAEYVYD